METRKSKMGKIRIVLIGITLMNIYLSGCSTVSGSTVGSGLGGATGAGVGYAIAPDSAVGPIIGGALGAAAGSEIGQATEQRRYYSPFHDR